MGQRSISLKQSAWCPTCQLYPNQERGRVRGERLCGGCGNFFTLRDSKASERAFWQSPEGQAIRERIDRLLQQQQRSIDVD